MSPTVIVRDSKPRSDTSELDVATSPYKVERNVDVDDPVEHARDPKRPPPISRRPARRSVEVRAKKWDPKGLHGAVRQIRFPELFNLSRYAVDLIEEMKREHGEPAACRVWINEVLSSGVAENHREKFVVTKHPGFPAYWGLFELVQKPSTGPHYRLVSIAKMESPSPEYLPPALQAEGKRWEHMRGEMGDPREFNRRDFEIMREQADSATIDASELFGKFQPQTDAQARKLRFIAIAKLAEKREAAEYDERDRQQRDADADMLDYTFDWLVQAANYGKKHKMFMGAVGQDPRFIYVPSPSGYVEKVRIGSSRERWARETLAAYQAEALARVGINVNSPQEMREYATAKVREPIEIIEIREAPSIDEYVRGSVHPAARGELAGKKS